MKFHSKKTANSERRIADSKRKLNAIRYTLYAKPAFSLIEAVTALVILAFVCSSVLTVINRCMGSAADSALRIHAFEVARENMETLLASDSVKEMVEYGSSDKYPEIQWQTVVETFYEPITERMWIQAICSSEYTDTAGDVQTVELTHWLTDLTKEQVREIIGELQKEKQRLAQEIVKTVEEAADYAGVDVETIEQWVENGMPKTEDGRYAKSWLDLYEQSDGNPSEEDKNRVAKEYAELIGQISSSEKKPQPEGPGPEKETDELPELGPDSTWDELMEYINKLLGQ